MKKINGVCFCILLLQMGCARRTNETGSGPTLVQGSGNGVTFTAEEFFMNVLPPVDVPMTLHDMSSWSAKCTIPLGTAPTDLTCFLEASELDLYYHGLDLAFNVPPNMCDYVRFTPTYFYQYRPGIGPTMVRYSTNAGLIDTSSLIFSGGTTSASFNEGTLTCGTDYKLSDGPNCCEGRYILSVSEVSGTPSTTTTFVDWGGDPANCLAGPAMLTQGKDKYGYPRPTMWFLGGKTLNESYKVSSPLSQGYFSIAFTTNFFVPSPTPGTGQERYPNTSAPTAFKAPFTGGRSGQATFELECLDHAHQLKYRISTLVRAWTRENEYKKSQNGVPLTLGSQDAPFSFAPNLNYRSWEGTGANGFFDSYPGNSL